MKHFTQLAAGLALVSSAIISSTTAAEVSYNIGFASEYYYRGILQKETSASAGVDFTEGGFYAGTWAADVGDGLEVDGYFGYNFEFEGGFTAGVGFTGYYYTGEFDDTYEEINFSAGYSIFGLEYSVGTYDNFGPKLDYDFLALTATLENGIYGKYGTFGDEFDGDYFELGYGMQIAEIDFGVAAIFSSDELSDQVTSSGAPTSSEALVFTISKTF